MRLGYRVFGLSVQTPEVLAEIASRNRLPFDLISDCEHKLLDILELPEFTHEGERLIKRMAWVIEKGVIRKVFYPVFPPDGNAATVLAFIKAK
jgi:peroxiredoxin